MLEILFFILEYVIFLLVIAIFLKLAFGIFKAENEQFGRVFITAFLITVVTAVVDFVAGLFLADPWLTIVSVIVGIIFSLLVISGMHKTGFWRALGVAVVAFILYILIIFLIGFILLVLLI